MAPIQVFPHFCAHLNKNLEVPAQRSLAIQVLGDSETALHCDPEATTAGFQESITLTDKWELKESYSGNERRGCAAGRQTKILSQTLKTTLSRLCPKLQLLQLQRGNSRLPVSSMELQTNSSLEYDYHEDGDELNTTFDYSSFEMLCVKEEVRTFNRSFLPAFYSIVFLVGLAGNSLVVTIYAYVKKLKTRTDTYILNLAIADLLLLLTLPFWAANAMHGWVLGIPLCKTTSAMYTVTFSASMQFLACISIDRYNAIVKLQGQPRVSKQCNKTCSFVWIASVLLCVPELIFNTVKKYHGRSACLPIFPESLGIVLKATVQIMEMALSFALPFLIMLICYSAVARTLIKCPSVKKSQPLKVLAAVVSVFIITQLPYNIVKLWRAIDIIYHLITDCNMSKTMDVAYQVTKSIALFHTCLNPILYFFVGASFQMHMVKIAKRCGYWRRQQSAAIEEIPMDQEDSTAQTSSFTI